MDKNVFVLVACEESQAVCKAFRDKGVFAFSCDMQFCSGGAPEWHIWGDVTSLLNGDCCFRTCDGKSYYVSRWDAIIAFPPCTYLSKAGASLTFKGGILQNERYSLGLKAVEFFYKIYNADCDCIAIENPVPMSIFNLPEPSQIVQPYYFGVPVSKKTYLWLKGLPFVCPTNVIDSIYTFKTYPLFKNSHGKYKQRNRSKTFPEFAEAMALSWCDYLLKK